MNNHSTTTPWSVHLRLLGMVMFWGASYSWAKTVVATVPPITAATLRFFLASFALFIWLHRLRRTRQLLTITARQWAGLTLAAISGIVLYTMCFMIALRHIDAGRAAVLFALSPVLTLLLAAWLFREKLNTLIVTGILLAVIGSTIVIAHGNPLTLLRGHIGIGEWLIFASIFLWTGYTLIGRKMLGGMDALSTTVATLLIGAVLLLPVSLIVEGTAGWATLLHATPATWGALLALAFGSTVLAYAWYFDGIRVLGAGNAAAYLTLEPVFGVLFAALWLGESLHLSLIGGGVLAVGGMVLTYLGRRRHGSALRRKRRLSQVDTNTSS